MSMMDDLNKTLLDGPSRNPKEEEEQEDFTKWMKSIMESYDCYTDEAAEKFLTFEQALTSVLFTAQPNEKEAYMAIVEWMLKHKFNEDYVTARMVSVGYCRKLYVSITRTVDRYKSKFMEVLPSVLKNVISEEKLRDTCNDAARVAIEPLLAHLHRVLSITCMEQEYPWEIKTFDELMKS